MLSRSYHYCIVIQAFDEKIEEYNISNFTSMAQKFEKQYHFQFPKNGDIIEVQIQYQYWNILNIGENGEHSNKQKIKITVEYAADLPVNKFGSSFPLSSSPKSKDDNFDYYSSSFNLNNTYRCPNSMLEIYDLRGQKISGITTPWVYMGMMFSTFCWHVENLGVNFLNQSHTSNIKTWSIIPESNKDKFDAFVIKKTGRNEVLRKITWMIDPLELIKNGIRVYKAYQKPRQYILTLFNAHHAGFSQGFNVGETVKVVTADSIDTIKNSINSNAVIKGQKAPVICYQWQIYNNLGNKYLPHQLVFIFLLLIQSQYSWIVNEEFQALKKLVDKINISSILIFGNAIKYDSCQTCKFYLYLSAFECVVCSKRYCLQHVDKCCSKGFSLQLEMRTSGVKNVFKLIEGCLK